MERVVATSLHTELGERSVLSGGVYATFSHRPGPLGGV
jgi:hypothetical protein